ncbi:protein of unknown function [Methylocaldum szegediense]|uniref:Transposase n=1 Tax=Methylocaldum szegediense TaxID=73780 RepID=A0ABM9I0D2_9GAMM|nr:protein of unknown function [Methylocaldum szegediense]
MVIRKTYSGIASRFDRNIVWDTLLMYIYLFLSLIRRREEGDKPRAFFRARINDFITKI